MDNCIVKPMVRKIVSVINTLRETPRVGDIAIELTTDLVVAKQVHSRIKEKGYDAILVEGYDDDGFWHRPHTLKIRND